MRLVSGCVAPMTFTLSTLLYFYINSSLNLSLLDKLSGIERQYLIFHRSLSVITLAQWRAYWRISRTIMVTSKTSAEIGGNFPTRIHCGGLYPIIGSFGKFANKIRAAVQIRFFRSNMHVTLRTVFTSFSRSFIFPVPVSEKMENPFPFWTPSEFHDLYIHPLPAVLASSLSLSLPDIFLRSSEFSVALSSQLFIVVAKNSSSRHTIAANFK